MREQALFPRVWTRRVRRTCDDVEAQASLETQSDELLRDCFNICTGQENQFRSKWRDTFGSSSGTENSCGASN